MSAASIDIGDVYRGYRAGGGEQAVLRGVSLAVAPGETTALLGRSGSGKSTLLNIISGIDRPDRGRVRVAGEELTGLGEARLTRFRRRHIGFIYQFFNLIPTLTAAENVALALELNGCRGRVQRTRVAELLAALGLGGLGRRFPDQLSGGEQQRVAIARALVHRPGLVLADEPTGNLDAETGAAVLGLLRERVAEAGSTLLMVTHSLAVAETAQRIVTLDAGQVVEPRAGLAW